MRKSLEEIELALRKARLAVFSDDPHVSFKAEGDIRRLLDQLRRHPEEIRRRAYVKAIQDEKLLRMWD